MNRDLQTAGQGCCSANPAGGAAAPPYQVSARTTRRSHSHHLPRAIWPRDSHAKRLLRLRPGTMLASSH